MCKIIKRLNEGEEKNNHICSGEYYFYCNKGHKTGCKQKYDEYRKKKEILNKMTEQKCDIYEAKKILGTERGKTYARITKEKRGGNTR